MNKNYSISRRGFLRTAVNDPNNREELLKAPREMKKGFTLIDILMVVVILGILALIVIPQFMEALGHSQRIVNKRINQSVAYWCFEKHWSLEKTCQVARQLGIKSIELISIGDPNKDPRHFKEKWDILKDHGLVDALHFVHGFERGLNNPENWEECLGALRKGIDDCAQYGFPNVLTFTGYRVPGISDEEALENCVTALKQVAPHAEEKGVTICIEQLNTRDTSHPMKGHPGYQGDRLDYVAEIVRKVGSPRVKLLFDVYHVQIMDGDIIRRIRQYKDYIGHYHVAGNPDRGEIGDTQELNYPAIMRAILETGYQGFVGQEFIPVRDPLESLREAVILCDV